MMKKRWIESNIKKTLQNRRITMLVGARQCGKTTLSKNIVDIDSIEYTTMDIEEVAAKSDPFGFVKHNKKTMIIDEIQRVPELILAIKHEVDNNSSYGQYIITGSADIQSLPSVKESLAGRAKKIRLRPFAYGEYLELESKFLERLKKKTFVNNTGYDKRKIIEIACNGGYPEPLIFLKEDEIKDWYKDYIDLIIDNDLKYVSNIRRQQKLRLLFETICAYSSKFITKSDLATELAVSRQTIDEYLSILERVYLIDALKALVSKDYNILHDKTKYFLNDTGLMCSTLNWKKDVIYKDADKSGKLIETFVYNQLAPIVDMNSDVVISHYRDNRKREIDFLLETENEIFGIEVKSGTDVNLSSFKHLVWFRDNLCKHKKFTGIIIYTGNRTMQWGNGMYTVPINNLWE